MAKRNKKAPERDKTLIESIKEDRYVLIVAVAILIFIASSSIALFSPGTEQQISPVYSSLKATVEGGAVTLSWGASKTADIDGYDIYRSESESSIGERLNALPVKELEYKDSVVPGTYYYTVRVVVGKTDDGNMRPLMVIASKVVPYGLSISINGASQYTKSENVMLSLSAMDAKECRYKNDDDPEWGAWEAYKVQKIWALSANGDGTRIVAYQCRNTGESAIAAASIILDREAPLIIATAPERTGNEVQMNIIVKDAISPSISCNATKDGTSEQFTIQIASGIGEYLYKTTVTDGAHTLAIACADEAGNVQEIPAQAIQ